MEEKAGSQDGTERLSIDGFTFESFPAKWPATEEKRKIMQEVLLSDDQILELRRFIESGQSASTTLKEQCSGTQWTYVSWYAYFNLQLPDQSTSTARGIIHTLANRKISKEYTRAIKKEAVGCKEEFAPISKAELVDSKAVYTQASVNVQKGEIPLLGNGFLLYDKSGGPNIILQLECGNPGAANLHAQCGPFKRNTGFSSSAAEQATASFADVVSQSDLEKRDIYTFADIPVRTHKDGGVWLIGQGKDGKELEVNMSENYSQTCLVCLVPFNKRFLENYFLSNGTRMKHFESFRSGSARSVGAYAWQEEDTKILYERCREVATRVLLYSSIFADHLPNEDPARFGSGNRLQSLQSQSTLMWQLFCVKNPSLDKEDVARLELGMSLYQAYTPKLHKETKVMNWLCDLSGDEVSEILDLKRQAILISVTQSLEEVTMTPEFEEFGELDGYLAFPPDVKLKEVEEGEQFSIVGEDYTVKRQRTKKPFILGLQSDEQASHLDAGFLNGMFTSVNIGTTTTHLGMHDGSGRCFHEIVELTEQCKTEFDKQFSSVPSFLQPGKKLHQVMGPVGASIAEKCATAWALFVDDRLRQKSPALALPWKRIYLPAPPAHMIAASLRTFHFGARFPLGFPQQGKKLRVPNNLVRFVLHDYHGPRMVKDKKGKQLESKDNETTVDIRADPALCAGCQYWAGSDGKYPPFAD